MKVIKFQKHTLAAAHLIPPLANDWTQQRETPRTILQYSPFSNNYS